MDDKFNEQKDILIAIKKEISLLHQQVDYLIRNEKKLELLDLDVMMNRTHKIYDLMCGVEIGSESLEAGDEEELPVGLDTIREMFGIEENEERQEVYNDEEPENPEELDQVEEPELEKEEKEEENEDAYFIEEVEDVDDEVPNAEEAPEETLEEAPLTPEENLQEFSEETNEESSEETNEVQSNDVVEEIPEDRGFILNFEPVEDPVEVPAENTVEIPKEEEPVKEEAGASVYTTGDEIEMTIPHLDVTEETEEEIAYEPVVIGDIKEKEDGGFELETPETLGERLQQQQDPTLADKLQHSALNSLQSAIGINDKFLFVNELFNGSMEKYNRSIANLDDLKTLNGALIYLNELRIELQWNSSNEAYKRLLELVHRKFGA